MRALFGVLLICILVACDSGPKPSPYVGGKSGDVKYWIEGATLHFGNHCDESTYQTAYAYLVTVTWCCNTYKGQKGRYVSLTFDGNDNWKITSEYETTGICE